MLLGKCYQIELNKLCGISFASFLEKYSLPYAL